MKLRSQSLTNQKRTARAYIYICYICILGMGMSVLLWMMAMHPQSVAAAALQQETATETPSETPSETPTETPTTTGTITATVNITETATATPSPTPTETATGTQPTATPTFTPTPTLIDSPLNTPTFTPTFTPSFTPAVPPTAAATQVVAPAVLNFTVDRGAVTNGESGILTWKLARASSATLSYNGVEETLDPNGGSMLISPLDTTVYLLRASGTGGEVGSELTVVVNTPTPTVPPPPTEPPSPDVVAAAATISAQETVDAATALVPTAPPTSVPLDTPLPTPTIIVVAQSGALTAPPVQRLVSASPTPAAVTLNLQIPSKETPPLSAQSEMDLQSQLAWNQYMKKIMLYGIATLGVIVPAILLILGVLLAGVWRGT